MISLGLITTLSNLYKFIILITKYLIVVIISLQIYGKKFILLQVLSVIIALLTIINTQILSNKYKTLLFCNNLLC